jgi:hypothetical protein
MWDPQHLTALKASTACYGDGFAGTHITVAAVRSGVNRSFATGTADAVWPICGEEHGVTFQKRAGRRAARSGASIRNLCSISTTRGSMTHEFNARKHKISNFTRHKGTVPHKTAVAST